MADICAKTIMAVWNMPHNNGRVEYAAKNDIFEIRKKMEMVFQSYHLFPHMTVLENVTLALTDVHHMPKDEAAAKGKAMLESLGLGDKINNRPSELSGGQKQRVAIARSCVTNPKLICFDEPTAALDPATTLEMGHLIQKLAKEGMGVLIISHDIPFVESISDRILTVEAGKII